MHRRVRAHAVVASVCLLASLAGCGDRGPGAATGTNASNAAAVRLGPAFGSMRGLPGLLTGPPPWPANRERLQLRLRAIGLAELRDVRQFQTVQRQHLDLFVDGRRVIVPVGIGNGPADAFFAAVHNHDSSGIIDVESPQASSYSLGQFFAVWGVRLDARCIGGLCATAGRRLRAWVNGKPVQGDPTRIVLDEEQQIVLAYGTREQDPDPVPASYAFPAAR